MENEKQMVDMAEELKLLKGEVKQSLASVRDYLLNMELPSSEFSTILAALSGGDGHQKITLDGGLMNPTKAATSDSEESTESSGGDSMPGDDDTFDESSDSEPEMSKDDDEFGGEDTFGDEDSIGDDDSFRDEDNLGSQYDSPEASSETLPEDELFGEDKSLGTDSEMLPEEEAGESYEEMPRGLESIESEPSEQDKMPMQMPESELPVEEEQDMEREMTSDEVTQSPPKVNLLANLISWVAKAKKEIGDEQLPIFLEVYGISGHLSPELKEIILHLSELSSGKEEGNSTPAIWSQAMLSLHGILTGGDAPLNPIKVSWGSEAELTEEEVNETRVEKQKDMPLKLKLVLPDSQGETREFCLDFNPVVDKSEV